MAVDAPDPLDDDELEPDIDDVDAVDAIAQRLRDAGPDPADAAADQLVQDQADQRAWLKAAQEIVSQRFERTDQSDRVQFALDMMAIAACERIGRILRSDLA